MKTGLILLVLCLASLALLASADGRLTTPWHALGSYTFDAYVKEFHKSYASINEYESRRGVFEARLAKIRAHNADPTKSWKEGVNHLTDRTEAELRQLRGYKAPAQAALSRFSTAPVPEAIRNFDFSKAPSHVDWREKGVVTPVKDQGQCGSCWTFATAETIESHYALKTGQLAVLSEQQILDCTPNPDQCGGTGGCAGGTAELAMRRIIDMGGLASEWTFPYRSYWGENFKTCNFSRTHTPPAAKISNYVKLPSNEHLPLLAAIVTQGPIAISVDASSWSAYESGIYNGCNQTHPDIDHAVQLVGYGIDPEHGEYWLVRNSWSPAWGESGYIRLSVSSSPHCGTDLNPADGTGCKGGPPTQTVCGTCGILFDNSYPIV
jgi:cathepsin L